MCTDYDARVLVMSDYDAALAVAEGQKVRAAPGSKKPAPQVEASTAALGKLFKLRFAECTFDEKAPDDLASNVTGIVGQLRVGARF